MATGGNAANVTTATCTSHDPVRPTVTTINAQKKRLAMSDDILTQLRSVLDPEMPLSERLVISNAIEEIERLRRELAMIRLVRLSEDLGLYE
jgi:hypothetical protein